MTDPRTLTPIRVLIIPVEGPIRVETVTFDLDTIKGLVGGWLEAFRTDEWVGYCDEEGKLKTLPVNVRATQLAHDTGWLLPDFLVGDVVFVGPTKRGEDTAVPQRLIDLAIPKETPMTVTTTPYAAAVDAAQARTEWTCPRCETLTTDYPARSRKDDTLAVCSPCGNHEAMRELAGQDPWAVAYGLTRDQLRQAVRALAAAGELSPAWVDMDPADVFRQYVEANSLDECAVVGCDALATDTYDILARPTTFMAVPLCDRHVLAHQNDERVSAMIPTRDRL